MYRLPGSFQQKKKKHVQHVEVVEEKEILVGEELVTTLIEESIPIKLEFPNLAVPYFEDNKNMEDEVISFQTKKVKITRVFLKCFSALVMLTEPHMC